MTPECLAGRFFLAFLHEYHITVSYKKARPLRTEIKIYFPKTYINIRFATETPLKEISFF